MKIPIVFFERGDLFRPKCALLQEMTHEEASIIRDFSLCDFNAIRQYYKKKSEACKQMTKEEKAKLKEENEKITEEYGWCIIDGHRERIGNFKTE